MISRRRGLAAALLRFLAGCQPLARGIIVLFGKEPPVRRSEAFALLETLAGPDAGVFSEITALKEGRAKPDAAETRRLFERCHLATARLGLLLDGLDG